MHSCIHFDLQALGDSAVSTETPVPLPARYAVVGTVLDTVSRRYRTQDTIHETNDLHDARIVCDLERHCAGINGYDSAIIWDRYQGREIPFQPRILVPVRRSAA